MEEHAVEENDNFTPEGFLYFRIGAGNWNVVRVRSFRHKRGIGVYREGERQERDELMVHEAAERLSVSESRVRHLIRRGIIPARQVCKGAPLVIAGKDLDLPETGTLQEGRIPLTTNPDQQPLDL